MKIISNNNKFLIRGKNQKVIVFDELVRKNGRDELPQLFNVLFGYLFLFGPRLKLITSVTGGRKNRTSTPDTSSLVETI